MKLKQIKYTLAVTAGLISSATLSLAADCDATGAKVKSSIEKSPEKLLVIVENAVSKNESCACEVVKAAIEASNADKQVVRDIVVTAVSAASEMAATIAECALAAAPEAAAEIRAGLSEVFEGGEAYSAGKNSKNVVVDESNDFGPDPIAVSGVYLIAPVAPSAASFGTDVRRLAQQLGISQREAALILRNGSLTEVLRRRVRQPRDDDRGGDNSTPTVQTP